MRSSLNFTNEGCSILKRTDRFFYNTFNCDPNFLAIVRIFYALYLLFGTGFFRFDIVGGMPDLLYQPPPGLGTLFSGFPHPIFLHVINIVVYTAAFSLLVGWQTRLASWLVTISLLLGFTFFNGFGGANHITLWAIFPAVMSFSNWGTQLSIDETAHLSSDRPRKATYAWPIALMALLIGMSFVHSGWSKAWGGWLHPDFQATRSYCLLQWASAQEAPIMGLWIRKGGILFWEAADWITVFFEISFLLGLLWTKFLRRLIILAPFFHLAVFLSLRIDYGFMIPIYLSFLATTTNKTQNSYFSTLIQRLRNVVQPFQPIYLLPAIIIYSLIYYLLPADRNLLGPPIDRTIFFGLSLAVFIFFVLYPPPNYRSNGHRTPRDV